MKCIDFRSDTVTHPTPRMRQAMANAEVGDDVYDDDPTVNHLQELAAQKFGKEAALFVSSGTMGNVIAILTHCGRAERVIMGDKSHTHNYEAGNPAALGGVQPWTVPVQPDGRLNLADIEKAISPRNDAHFPYTKAVSIENTQGSVGGQPLPVDYMRQVGELCRQHDLKFHVDGARIFNAAAALQSDVKSLTEMADSVTFCLSKGLCAPVGSVLLGSAEFIRRAYRLRKLLGGAMRQAGILAAAGIVALEEMTERLSEDHAHAKELAIGLASIPALRLDVERVKSNMVFFDLAPDAPLSPQGLSEALRQDNILINPISPYGLRAVTHYWIQPNHVTLLVERIRHYLS